MTWTLCLLFALGGPAPVLNMPEGSSGIGFDDLTYAPALERVLVPAGRTGRLNLIDPKTLKVESLSGFSVGAKYGGGHAAGTTSADVGAGLIFATDRDRHRVRLIDPGTRQMLASADLGGAPDYVRWVEPLKEVWVTIPDRLEIEFFALEGKRLVRRGQLAVPDGPESLVIDAARGRAYTNSWHGRSYAIELKAHRIAETWTQGCKASRGLALDAERGWLFVGCEEGAAVALAVSSGKQLGRLEAGAGVDIIAYAPKLRHLYVPGGDAATMVIGEVDAKGALTAVGTVPTAKDAHCVTTAGDGRLFVCAPEHGQILVIQDPAAGDVRGTPMRP